MKDIYRHVQLQNSSHIICYVYLYVHIYNIIAHNWFYKAFTLVCFYRKCSNWYRCWALVCWLVQHCLSSFLKEFTHFLVFLINTSTVSVSNYSWCTRDRNPFQNLGFHETSSGTLFQNLRFQGISSGIPF
jgi:hypothetical protein